MLQTSLQWFMKITRAKDIKYLRRNLPGILSLKKFVNLKRRNALREKCPYSELFWSLFSGIRTEYGEILHIQSKCGKMRTRITPNTDTFNAVIKCKRKDWIAKEYNLNPLQLLKYVNCWWQQNQELPNIIFLWNVLSENGITLSEWAYLLRSKNNVNFTEACFF